jgi:hypothetical protein
MGMRGIVLAAAMLCCASAPSWAVEGSSAAGPIGGTDVRVAQLPPPGLYGGVILLYAEAYKFFDANGRPVPAFNALDLSRTRAGPFLLYGPDVQVFGGSIGFFGVIPFGTECGRLFEGTPRRCIAGAGDPYVEAVWSRFFGTMRPSKFPGAYPIAEGLTLALGFGAVIPIGTYNVNDATMQGLAIGNNIWDLSPTVAVTYVTKPILADGTEFSAKFYWNNYLKNPATQYATGTLLNTDFAITERIGRWQIGIAGFYAFQVADDTLAGVRVPPDGRRTDNMMLGGVLVYDMPEHAVSMKIKGLTTVITNNSVGSYGVTVGWIKKH